MKRQLFSLIITSNIVLTSIFSNVAMATDTYDLNGHCSFDQDKCSLSMDLTGTYSKPIPAKKIILRVNGKPVSVDYNDQSPLDDNFAFHSSGSVSVTCGKTYAISAHIVKATSNAETKVAEPQPVVCPVKTTF